MINLSYYEWRDRFVNNDRYLFEPIKYLLRPQQGRRSGMQNVVHNTLQGMGKIGVACRFNHVPSLVTVSREPLVSFGLGLKGLSLVNKKRPVILAIGFGDFAEYEYILDKYNVIGCIQHSNWVADLVAQATSCPRDLIRLWPAGISTDFWQSTHDEKHQILIYKKLHTLPLEKQRSVESAIGKLCNHLISRGIPYKVIVYGSYQPEYYRDELSKSVGLVFFSPSESLGFAILEALSCDVPVLAWSPGSWSCSMQHLSSKILSVSCSSAPCLDESSGQIFNFLDQCIPEFDRFYEKIVSSFFSPRRSVCGQYDLPSAAKRLLSIVSEFEAL